MVNVFFRCFVLTAGDGLPTRLEAAGGGVADNTVNVAGLDHAAERRQFVKLVALGGKGGGAGFNYFGDFI